MTHTDDPAPAAQQDSFERWAWVLGAVWLVFLGFTVATVLAADLSPAATALGLVLLAGFALIYSLGFACLVDRGRSVWWSVTAIVLLVALTGGVAGLIGFGALGMAPFVVSFAIWGFTWPRAFVVATALALVAMAAVVVSQILEFGILIMLVYGLAAFVRFVEVQAQRSRRHQEQLALVAERDRVARDVHDVLGHSLTAIAVKSEVAERMVDIDTERTRAEISEMRTLARTALAEIRATVSGLRVTRIEDELKVAQRALTDAAIRAVIPTGADVVLVQNRIVLAWALRESVTNVVRHSRADSCEIALGPESLTVTDDGVGAAGPEGNGLRGLRERVEAAGGSVRLGTGPNETGHRLEVIL